MLNLDVKKLFVASSIPSSLTIDGYSYPIRRTLGSTPIDKLILPTVNVRFFNEDTPYYRSIDDGCKIVDNISTFTNINACTVRYTVATEDFTTTASQSIKYVTGTDVYEILNKPVIDIVSIGTFVKNTDYKLSNDHTSIEWIGNKPSNNSTFNVNYKWTNSGYFINHQLTDYLIKYIKGNFLKTLNGYGIGIVDFKGVKDISDVYGSDVLNVFAFDFIITYPFEWNITLTDEDAVIANTITFDLYANGTNIDTISYHND
jgi:hypothetical protein